MRRLGRRRAVVPVGLLVALGLTACAGPGAGSAGPVAPPLSPGMAGATAQAPAPVLPTGSGTPVVPGVPGVVPADSCRLVVEKMSPAELAGQLVMVGHDLKGATASGTAQLVASQHLGGVLLMNNSTAGVEAVRTVTDAIRADAGRTGKGLLITVDQEGVRCGGCQVPASRRCRRPPTRAGGHRTT
ncbi:hypothetical protein [Raineyella fluvialis]|uniref:Beta-N-acetylhexosaminidase n=1 Tax=Raineyella fluvialis TaxID=2662261 RepID=A0A5Q2FFR7_9ACTN|nr:hypothetical protein [Raineyella fluvialis]QGF23963.1 hypothetical protein Rai3103_10065 [Raineyella fluvialis]